MRPAGNPFPVLAMLALAAATASPAAGSDSAGLIDIVVEMPAQGQMLIAAEVVGFAPGEVEVDLRVERDGVAGTIASSQTQPASTKTGERSRAAAISVSFAPGDRIAATATLRLGDVIISTATISAGGPQDAARKED